MNIQGDRTPTSGWEGDTVFISGDLVFFVYQEGSDQIQTGGIVISCDDTMLTIALPHGVEILNMRSPIFGRGWVVEHAPETMSPAEALAFSRVRLAELAHNPPVVVHPLDEGYRAPVEHAHPVVATHSY